MNIGAILAYAYSEILIIGGITGEDLPIINQPDPTVVAETLQDYPSLQSRWDSKLAGILAQPRPTSWALPEDFKQH